MSDAEMVDLTKVKIEKDSDISHEIPKNVQEPPQNTSNLSENVVKSIPAYLSREFAGKLYLVQHPLKPATACLETQSYRQVKYKPGVKKFQFTLDIDTHSSFYDKNKSENLARKAVNVPGEEGAEFTEDKNEKIDSVTLEGTEIPLPSGPSRYVIGIIKKDEIHLCPLEAIIQVKPTFPYLNKADTTKLAQDAHTDTEDEEEATKITVKFSRNSRDPNAKEDPRKPKYFSVAKKKEEEEAWIAKDYREYHASNVKKVMSKNIGNELSYYPVNEKEYLDLQFPKFSETSFETDKKKLSNDNKISITQLKQMSFSEQIRIIMIKGKVLQYRQIEDFLRNKLKAEFEEASLLRTIQTVACLVQGCWVVRSDIVYSADAVSTSNKNNHQTVLQNARDLILSRFDEHRIQERKKLCSLTHLPDHEVTEILKEISIKVPRKGWEFRLPFDKEFTANNTAVVDRQAIMWAKKVQPRIRNSSISDKDSTKDSRSAAASNGRRRSRTKSISSDSGAESDSRSRRGVGGRQRRLSSRSDAGVPTRVEP